MELNKIKDSLLDQARVTWETKNVQAALNLLEGTSIFGCFCDDRAFGPS